MHDAIHVHNFLNQFHLKFCLPIVGSCGRLTVADLVAELTVDERPRILPNADPISAVHVYSAQS